jgi:hypothetical protein
MDESPGTDLAGLFTQLEGDVASVCSPPGATLAVATVRRRRRMTLGIVLAVVVLIGAAATLGSRLGHDAPVQASHRPLPEPKHLSAARLSTATAGWITHLTPGVLLIPQLLQQSLHGLPCFGPEKALVDDPASRTRRFATSSFAVALVVVRELPQADAQRLDSQLVDGLGPCRTVPEREVTYPGGAVVDYASQLSKAHDLHVWVARRGDFVGLLMVGGAGNLPAYDTVDHVSDLLVAALANPAAGSP